MSNSSKLHHKMSVARDITQTPSHKPRREPRFKNKRNTYKMRGRQLAGLIFKIFNNLYSFGTHPPERMLATD